MSNFDKYGKAGSYMQLLLKVGTVMIVSILFFFAIGFFLIRLFELNGSFIIVFVFIGVVLGFYNVYREIVKLE